MSVAITAHAFTDCHSFTDILLISPAHCADRVRVELAVMRPVFSIDTGVWVFQIIYVSTIKGVFSDSGGIRSTVPQLESRIDDMRNIAIGVFMGIKDYK